MFTNIHKHSSIFIESNAGKLPSERAETLQISGHPDAHVDHGILTDLVRYLSLRRRADVSQLMNRGRCRKIFRRQRPRFYMCACSTIWPCTYRPLKSGGASTDMHIEMSFDISTMTWLVKGNAEHPGKLRNRARESGSF